jgi:FixJ family two-component response regulator
VRTYKTVSIIDDDESIRASTASLVRSMGWEACVYESADHFLGSIGIRGIGGIGCIVCDVQMPGMTGLELLGKLRDDGYSFTIIFVTAYSSDEVNREALAGGALCALEKPVDPTLLSDWLCRALDDRA